MNAKIEKAVADENLIIGKSANSIVEMLFEQELESEFEQLGLVEFQRQWQNGLSFG